MKYAKKPTICPDCGCTRITVRCVNPSQDGHGEPMCWWCLMCGAIIEAGGRRDFRVTGYDMDRPRASKPRRIKDNYTEAEA